MTPLSRIVLALFALLLAPVAQAQSDPAAYATRLDRAANELGTVDGLLDTRPERDARATLRTRAQVVRSDTLDAAQQSQAELTRIDARLAQLGPAATGEDPAIRSERGELTRQHGVLDSATKRARLLSVEAQQLIDEISAGEAAEFSQKLFGKVSSPLTPAFWSAILHAVPRDLHRLQRFVAAEAVTIGRPGLQSLWPLLIGAATTIAGR